MRSNGVLFSIALAAIVALGCVESSQQKIARLQSSVDSLTAESEQKTQAINEFFASITAIEESLAEVRNREEAIGESVKNYTQEEIPPDLRGKIDEDITAINEIMARNRRQIVKLNETLRKSNIQATELQRIIKSTEQKLNERDQTITQLMGQLETLNFNIDSLTRAVDTLSWAVDTLSEANELLAGEVASKTEKLNEAWYAIGKRSELIDNNVIENRVMAKNYRLRRDFNRNYFTKIDISQTDVIPLFSSGASVVVATSHPAESYTFDTDENGNVRQLRIVDKVSFWSASRYLVVVIK